MENDTYIKENKKKSFWAYAKCTHSLPRFADGCQKYRHKYDFIFGLKKFIRFRRYKDSTGEIRKTIEIEI